MSTPSLVPLAGSARSALPAAATAGSVDPDEEIELTVITRRAASLPRDSEGVPARLSLSELRQRYSSDPADHAFVTDVLTRHEPALRVTRERRGKGVGRRQPGTVFATSPQDAMKSN